MTIRSATDDFLLGSRFWNFTDISVSHQIINPSKPVVCKFCMGISPQKGNLTQWHTIGKSRCDICVFQIHEPIGSSGQNFDILTFKGVNRYP